jgi:hypothetical protein
MTPDGLEDLKETAATIYAAGAETVSTGDIGFCLASTKAFV